MKFNRALLGGVVFGALVAVAGLTLSPAALAGEGTKSAAAGGEAMAKVGSAAPDFTLKDTTGKEHKLSDLTKSGKIVVLEWFNSGCPFVVRHHDKYKTMADTAKKYADKNVVWIAINSGAPGKEGYGKDADAIKNWKMAYPVLNDETGKVGKLYGAKTTPHMYVIDSKGILAYAGAIDDDRKDEKPADKKINYVAKALDEITSGKPVTNAETQAYGCSVKYGG